MQHCIFLLVISVVLFGYTFGKSPKLTIIWDSFNCTSNSKYLRSTNCWVRASDRKTISLETTLLTDLSDIKIEVQAFVHRNGIRNGSPFYRTQVDYCELLGGKQKNQFVSSFYKSIKNISNIPRKCPILRNVTYFIREFARNPRLMTIHMPDTQFSAVLIAVTSPNDKFLTLALQGRLVMAKL